MTGAWLWFLRSIHAYSRGKYIKDSRKKNKNVLKNQQKNKNLCNSSENISIQEKQFT